MTNDVRGAMTTLMMFVMLYWGVSEYTFLVLFSFVLSDTSIYSLDVALRRQITLDAMTLPAVGYCTHRNEKYQSAPAKKTCHWLSVSG